MQDKRTFTTPVQVRISLTNIIYDMFIGSPQEELEVSPNGLYFERDFIEELLRSISSDDVVWDVGAGTGAHTIPSALKTGKHGLVFAFEPDEERADMLERNINLNQLTNIVVCKTALWKRDTSVILHTSGTSGTAPKVREEELVDEVLTQRILIQGRSIQSLVKSAELPPPNVIKIDVEGAGMKVLEGMGTLRPPHIFIEIHPRQRYRESGEDRDEIAALLGAQGYTLATETSRIGELHCHFVL